MRGDPIRVELTEMECLAILDGLSLHDKVFEADSGDLVEKVIVALREQGLEIVRRRSYGEILHSLS